MKKSLLIGTLLLLITCLGFAQPVITSFTPKSGAVGSTVTITGTGFNTSLTGNLVFFGTVPAIVTAATSTSIKVTVPTGVSYSPIGVLNTSTKLSAYSVVPFLLTFADGNATVGLEPRTDLQINYATLSITMGDLDGDGKLDIVVTNTYDTLISIFHNNSETGKLTLSSFDTKTDFRTAVNPEEVSIGDIDRDGKPDLVVTCYNSETKGAISVLRNTSTKGVINSSSFAPKVDFLTGAYPYSSCISDLNGDGKPDISLVSSSDSKIYIFRNTSVPGTIGTNSFAAAVSYPTTLGPTKLVVDDMDGDNKPDLIAGGLYLTIFRNTSAGGASGQISFAAGVQFSSINAQSIFTTGDLDGDGKSDLIYFEIPRSILIYRNISTKGSISVSSFQTPVKLTNLMRPHDLDLGDMDGDGKPDIIIPEFDGNKITVIRNTSTAGSITESSFAEKTEFPSEFKPSALYAADMDGDGKSDIAVANYGSDNISVFRNNTAPFITRFTPTSGSAGDSITIYGSNLTGVSSVKIGATDVKSFDIINNWTIKVIIAAGSKGLIEVTSPNGKAISTQSFMASPVILSHSPAAGPVGSTVTISGQNFNSAAENNIVFFGGTTAKVLTASTSTLTVTVPAGTTYRNITVLDKETGLSGTGNKVFNVTFNSYISASSLSAVPDITGSRSYNLNTADLDNDGKTDFVVVDNNANRVSVFRNTTSDKDKPTFARIDYKTGDKPSVVKIADLDGDGKPDLIVANNISKTLTILRNSCTPGNLDSTSFAEKSEIQLRAIPGTLAVGDIDNDGKIDIIAGFSGAYDLSIFRNISNPGKLNSFSFEKEFQLKTGMGSSFLEICDFDNDGRADVLSATNGGRISIFRNISSSGIIQQNSFAPSINIDYLYISALTTGDLDDNGKTDLIVTNYSAGKAAVFANNSVKDSLKFSAKIEFTCGYYPTAVNVADMNGDGKPDLVFAGDGTISVVRNTSSIGSFDLKSFAQKTNYYTTSYNLIASDINGDGKTDIVYGHKDISNIKFLINNPLAPVITTLSGTTGLKGSSLTINGKDFEDVLSVSIGGVAVKSFIVSSNTSIIAEVQKGNSGTVTVTTKYGTGTSAGTFALVPEVFSVTGGGTYLKGTSGVSVGLSGSEKGMLYQLQRGDTLVGAPLPGTDSALDFGLQKNPGSYTVTSVNSVDKTAKSNMLFSAIVKVNDIITSTQDELSNGLKLTVKENLIEVHTETENTQLQIIDVTGKIIFDGEINNSSAVQVSGQNLYLVKTTNGITREVKRVFVP